MVPLDLPSRKPRIQAESGRPGRRLRL